MKRFIAMLLIFCMLAPLAVAEDYSPESLWDSIGGWFNQAWKDTSSWVSQAWKDASQWAEGAWGEASEWIVQAWSDSSQWVNDIWGDVSAWASETYDAASGSFTAWWNDTFNRVTDSTAQTWDWIVEESDTVKSRFKDEFETVKKAVSAAESAQEGNIRKAYDQLLKKLNLSSDDTQKVWDTIRAYAEENGISPLSAEILGLPYLFQLTVDKAESNEDIPAIVVAQYLTGVIEKLGVKTSEAADTLIKKLSEAFNSI